MLSKILGLGLPLMAVATLGSTFSSLPSRFVAHRATIRERSSGTRDGLFPVKGATVYHVQRTPYVTYPGPYQLGPKGQRPAPTPNGTRSHPPLPSAFLAQGWAAYYAADGPYFAQVDTATSAGTAWRGAGGRVFTCWHVVDSTLDGTTTTQPVTLYPVNPTPVQATGGVLQYKTDAHEGWGYVGAMNRAKDLVSLMVASWPYQTPGGLHWNTHPVWAGEPVAVLGFADGGNILGWESGKIVATRWTIRVGPHVGTESDIWTTAWTTGGDSGGVLLNPWNQVLGIVEAANWNPNGGDSGGDGYALPIQDAQSLTPTVIAPSADRDPVPWWNHL